MERMKKGVASLLILAMCLSMGLQCADPVSAAEETNEYSVRLKDTENGVIQFKDSKERTAVYKSKDTVTVRILPEEGFLPAQVEILDEESQEEVISAEWTGKEEFSFQMPEKNVVITAGFEPAVQEQEEAIEGSSAGGLQDAFAGVEDIEAGIQEESGDDGLRDGGGIEEPQAGELRTYASARSGGTSTQLKGGIGRIQVYNDANVMVKSHNEGMLAVNGTQAFCADPLAGFKSGSVTGVDPREYGMTQHDVTVCALIHKYAQEYTSLTEDLRYLVAQCLIWRQLNGTFGWNCGNIHIDGANLEIGRQGQIYAEILNKVSENYSKYIGEGMVYLNGATQPLAQFSLKPALGYIRLHKSSGNTEITEGNSCYSLEGAQYGVYQDAACTRLAATLTTDANGDSDTASLEPGDYYVKEIRAPRGYALDYAVYDARVTTAQTTDMRVSDEPVRDESLIEVYKIDRGTKMPGAEGAASLENSRFQVNFYAGYYDQEHLPDKPTRSWIVKARTLRSGNAAARRGRTLEAYEKTSGDPFYSDGGTFILPLGTVSIEEVGAPVGYLLDPVYMQLIDGSAGDVEKAEGKYVSQVIQNGSEAALDGGNAYAVADSVIRGDFSLTKIDRNTQTPLEGVRFKITSNTTGESHEFTTDANGQYSSCSDYAAHSHNTNGGNIGDGIWFGLNADGVMAAVDDNSGALPYDTYTIEELKCDANEGKFLYKGTVSITKDQYVVNLGNIENADVAVSTTAKDEASGTHYAKADSEVTLLDTVEYIGLKKGLEYRLEASLMNRNTGNPVEDKDGAPVSATKKFKPKDSNGTAEVEILFDASGLAGMDVVVFEELYLGEEKLAEHKDVNEESQTIHFPGIGTQAKDSDTDCELSKADDEITLIDTVAYENLRIGRKYTLTGILMDKETKKPALDKDGDKIRAKTEFTAETASGTVEVVFKFDGSNLGGKTLVAFETLTKDKHEYAVHQDIEDEAQTIYIPKIGTEARDEDTGSHISRADPEVTIIDEVKYENLVPGREYTLEGVLIDQKTKKEKTDEEGNKIISQAVFTPSKPEGSVELAFQFDGSGYAGETLVVYEELLYREKTIAEHKDAGDSGQTIYFPKIATTASAEETGEKSVYADQKVKIEDLVRYENLIQGKTYKVRGILMDKASKQSMKDAKGAEITAETEFTAEESSGEVKVNFEFDGSILAGKTTVVFEELFAEEKSIAVHADIEDEDQSVELVSPPGRSRAPKTGDIPLKLICIYVVLFVACGGLLVRLELRSSRNL